MKRYLGFCHYIHRRQPSYHTRMGARSKEVQFERFASSGSQIRYFRTIALVCMLLEISAFTQGQSTFMIDDLQVDPRGDNSVRFTSSVATPGIQIDTNQRMKMRPYSSDDGL